LGIRKLSNLGKGRASFYKGFFPYKRNLKEGGFTGQWAGGPSTGEKGGYQTIQALFKGFLINYAEIRLNVFLNLGGGLRLQRILGFLTNWLRNGFLPKTQFREVLGSFWKRPRKRKKV